MDKLTELRADRDSGSKSRIDLSDCKLTTEDFGAIFESDILPHAETLEILNLGGNHMTELPDSFAKLKKLKILFFASNDFESIPMVLKDIELNMLSFKGNQLKSIPEGALNPSITWLILTDNQLTSLPRGIGKLTGLRKVMLAANKLTSLPEEMKQCVNIELIRLSSNALTELPDWLLELPRLSWIAFAGNKGLPGTEINEDTNNESEFEVIDYADLDVKEKLGEGASGEVYRALHSNREVALKFFRGAATSDGLPEDEIKVMQQLGNHDSSVSILGTVKGAPGGQLAAVLPLIPPSFKILGNPPSFDTCTRDTYPKEKSFTTRETIDILEAIAGVCHHLHCRGLSHGDIYAHNILVEEKGGDSGERVLIRTRSKLSDFGAASFASFLHPKQVSLLEKVEVRAFGCLVEELTDRIVGEGEETAAVVGQLRDLQKRTRMDEVHTRPSFFDVHVELTGLLNRMK